MPSEEDLIEPFLAWLIKSRRVRMNTIVLREMPWYGRRIDVATLTATGRSTAYELKLRNTQRAIEQAANNKLAFHRSYAVVHCRPSEPNVALALRNGVGVIVVRDGHHKVLLQSPSDSPDSRLRSRLRTSIRVRAGVGCV